jgi:hypothetical protein
MRPILSPDFRTSAHWAIRSFEYGGFDTVGVADGMDEKSQIAPAITVANIAVPAKTNALSFADVRSACGAPQNRQTLAAD